MEEHHREALTKPILPVELTQPGFWAVFLPELVAWEDKYLEWVKNLEHYSFNGFSESVFCPELILTLPYGYRLVLSLNASVSHHYSEFYYYLKNADLPDGGLLGHSDCHCQLPIFRWAEALKLAQVIQKANPMLPAGTALLLLWHTLWLNDSEFQEAKLILLSVLDGLKLKPGPELTNPLRTSYEGQAATGELPDVEFEWWEIQPGDWANNSLYSLRSITAFPGTKWNDPTRKKFNRVLEKLGVSSSNPTL
ncbi:hypothetical protein V3W47_15345 [Deinococcus sp. YIM 134068]|uniref:hypothetical protein n=1 Tax=Deinococcus lichenicola TaxID=3118910 RepID=UPI002F92886D